MFSVQISFVQESNWRERLDLGNVPLFGHCSELCWVYHFSLAGPIVHLRWTSWPFSPVGSSNGKSIGIPPNGLRRFPPNPKQKLVVLFSNVVSFLALVQFSSAVFYPWQFIKIYKWISTVNGWKWKMFWPISFNLRNIYNFANNCPVWWNNCGRFIRNTVWKEFGRRFGRRWISKVIKKPSK